jgi:hypothetical protein
MSHELLVAGKPAMADELKTAGELIERAAELVQEAAKQTYLPSEAMRQTVREETRRLRFKLFMLRRALTMLRTTANRRKPTSGV